MKSAQAEIPPSSALAAVLRYGELCHPELNTLSSVTAGAGLRPYRKTSLDVSYHRYERTELAEELREVRVAKDFTGDYKTLSDEVDRVLSYLVIPGVEFEIGFGYFKPGRVRRARGRRIFTQYRI